MDRTCNMHEEMRNLQQNLMGLYHFEDIGVDGTTILKCILDQ